MPPTLDVLYGAQRVNVFGAPAAASVPWCDNDTNATWLATHIDEPVETHTAVETLAKAVTARASGLAWEPLCRWQCHLFQVE